MGGGLALMLASQRPDKVRAVVPFYGVVPWEGVQPDYPALTRRGPRPLRWEGRIGGP